MPNATQQILFQDWSHKCFHTYLQCFSTLLLRAIFSPISVQTGWVSTIFAKSALTANTRPPVDRDPMFTINTSFLDNFWTYKIKCKAHKKAPSSSWFFYSRIRTNNKKQNIHELMSWIFMLRMIYDNALVKNTWLVCLEIQYWKLGNKPWLPFCHPQSLLPAVFLTRSNWFPTPCKSQEVSRQHPTPAVTKERYWNQPVSLACTNLWHTHTQLH